MNLKNETSNAINFYYNSIENFILTNCNFDDKRGCIFKFKSMYYNKEFYIQIYREDDDLKYRFLLYPYPDQLLSKKILESEANDTILDKLITTNHNILIVSIDILNQYVPIFIHNDNTNKIIIILWKVNKTDSINEAIYIIFYYGIHSDYKYNIIKYDIKNDKSYFYITYKQYKNNLFCNFENILIYFGTTIIFNTIVNNIYNYYFKRNYLLETMNFMNEKLNIIKCIYNNKYYIYIQFINNTYKFLLNE